MLAKAARDYINDEQWTQPIVDGAQFAMNERVRFAAGLLAQVHEHAISIRLLLGMPRPQCRFGSAAALVRPIFEGLVRALWILDCADEAQLKERLTRDDGAWKPGLQTMCADVDKVVGGALFSDFYAKKYAAMCSYAHGGLRVVSHNLSADWVEPTSTEENWAELVAYAHAMDLLATHAALTFTDRADQAGRVLERAGVVMTTKPGALP